MVQIFQDAQYSRKFAILRLTCYGLWPYADIYVKDLVFICGLAKPSFMKEVAVLIFEELF